MSEVFLQSPQLFSQAEKKKMEAANETGQSKVTSTITGSAASTMTSSKLTSITNSKVSNNKEAAGSKAQGKDKKKPIVSRRRQQNNQYTKKLESSVFKVVQDELFFSGV